MLCNPSTKLQVHKKFTPYIQLYDHGLFPFLRQKASRTLRRSLLRTTPSNPLLNFFLSQDLNSIIREDVAKTGPNGGSCDEVSTQLAWVIKH